MQLLTGILLSLFLLLSSTCYANNTISQIEFITGEWPPYTSESLPGYGPAAILVSAVCEKIGITPVFLFRPWKRAETELLNGKAFAAFPYAKTNQRKNKFLFSDILYSTTTVLMYHQNKIKPDLLNYKAVKDLRGYTIGGIRGGFYESILKHKGINFEGTNSIEQSLNKLKIGRVDLCIGGKLVLYDAVNTFFPEDIKKFKVLGQSFGEKTHAYLMISKSYPRSEKIREKFNHGLSQLIKSGDYIQLINKYNLTIP